MTKVEILDIYHLGIKAAKHMENGDYSQVYGALRQIVRQLMARKDQADLEWKLRIAELITIGIVVPLQMFAVYGSALENAPGEILQLIGTELECLNSGVKKLLVSAKDRGSERPSFGRCLPFGYKVMLN